MEIIETDEQRAELLKTILYSYTSATVKHTEKGTILRLLHKDGTNDTLNFVKT